MHEYQQKHVIVRENRKKNQKKSQQFADNAKFPRFFKPNYLHICIPSYKAVGVDIQLYITYRWALILSSPGNPNRIISAIRFKPGGGSAGTPPLIGSLGGISIAGADSIGANRVSVIGVAAETVAKSGNPGFRITSNSLATLETFSEIPHFTLCLNKRYV